MRKVLCFVVVAVILPSVAFVTRPQTSSSLPPATAAAAIPLVSTLRSEANRGQAGGSALFVSRGPRDELHLGTGGASMWRHDHRRADFAL